MICTNKDSLFIDCLTIKVFSLGHKIPLRSTMLQLASRYCMYCRGTRSCSLRWSFRPQTNSSLRQDTIKRIHIASTTVFVNKISLSLSRFWFPIFFYLVISLLLKIISGINIISLDFVSSRHVHNTNELCIAF